MAIDGAFLPGPPQTLSFPNLETYIEEKTIPDDYSWAWFRAAFREAPKLKTILIPYPSHSHHFLPFPQMKKWDINGLVNILVKDSVLYFLV